MSQNSRKRSLSSLAAYAGDTSPPKKQKPSPTFSRSFNSVSNDNQSKDFPIRAKEVLRHVYGSRRCWHCRYNIPTWPNPVVWYGDTRLQEYDFRGLISIRSVVDQLNGILLCPCCSMDFADPHDSRFIIIPDDLEFFFDWEYRDMTRRQLLIESYKPFQFVTRVPPTAEDYKTSQIEKGVIGMSHVGGYYRKFLTSDILHDMHPALSLGQRFAPCTWHGDPMAVLLRARQSLGSAPGVFVPSVIRRRIRKLFRLYDMNDLKEKERVETLLRRVESGDAGVNSRNCVLPSRGTEQEASSPDLFAMGRIDDAKIFEKLCSTPRAKWGPFVTSADAMRFYRIVRAPRRQQS